MRVPRTADHDERRRQIAGAVQALVASSGLDAATMAAVARRAGFSVGLVQHYFASKDDLLLFTYTEVTERIMGRVTQRIAERVARQETIATVVYASLCELLPFGDARLTEYRVTLAFLGRTVDNPTLAQVASATAASIRDQLATAVTNGKECGEVEPAVDAEVAAVRLVAVVDGLVGQLYDNPDRKVGRLGLRAVAQQILRECIDDIFTGECRQYG